MKRRSLQLNPRHRATFYIVGTVLLVTGAAWARVQNMDEAGQAGEGLRQLKRWLIELHGLSAVGFVFLLGTLIPGHVRNAWRAGKNRTSGVFILTVMSFLSLTGYALYYLGDEGWRRCFSGFHLWLGLASPLILFWHIRTGRRLVR